MSAWKILHIIFAFHNRLCTDIDESLLSLCEHICTQPLSSVAMNIN